MTSMSRNLLTAAVVALLVAGCGGSSVNKVTNTGSVGKELEDLKRAYDRGAITQSEYNQARARILNQRD